jgi:hypothetical protein
MVFSLEKEEGGRALPAVVAVAMIFFSCISNGRESRNTCSTDGAQVTSGATLHTAELEQVF